MRLLVKTSADVCNISSDLEARFDTSNFPKKVMGIMKDEARGKIIEEFVGEQNSTATRCLWEAKQGSVGQKRRTSEKGLRRL